MASKVGIVNRALRNIGALPIVSLTEGTKNANIANDLYDEVRLDLLRRHPWNFATARVKLGKLAAAPTYEFDNAFQLPADFVRIVEVHDNDDGAGGAVYRRQANTILSDVDEVWLTYIKNEEDPNTMSPGFRAALAAALAHEFAIALVQSNTLREQSREAAEATLRVARTADAQEDYPEPRVAGSWVSERGR